MRCVFLAILYFLSIGLYANPPIEIILWHSLAGHLGEEVNQLALEFNQSQNSYRINPIYKGDYLECLTSFSAAFRAHQPPAIVQVFEVGKMTMLSSKGLIKPVHELMKEAKLALPVDSFFPALRNFYSEHGQLMAMPFNTSVPALFYNADALKKAGYSEANFPNTWDEFEAMAMKLQESGASCVYTSAHPAWIFIESFAALHDLPLMAPDGVHALYNNAWIVGHLTRLLRWQTLHLFEYGGRTDDATALFTSGRCLLYSQSSGSYNGLKKLVSFQVGMAPMPFSEDITKKRYANVVGGAAFWVVQGHSSEVYQGIAQFFYYLTQPNVQERWVQNTGYLPLGVRGIYKSFAQYPPHPAVTLALHELESNDNELKNPTRGIQNQIRVINGDLIEAIFARIKSPKEALDTAVFRANQALLRFKRNVGNDAINN